MTPLFKSLKLEDIKELRELVADSVDSVEPGLRLLDAGVVLGGAAIDLLTLDAAGVVTLIALGLQADDETMLRALEAYSWCREDPDALRRLYPAARLSAAEPPRVIFIAERIPEAFLRKIRHLRFHRVDCLEFRFGLQFNVVGEVRAAGEAPPARPARSERTPASSPAPVPPVARVAPAVRPEPPRPAPRREPAPPGPPPRPRRAEGRSAPAAPFGEASRGEPLGERDAGRDFPPAGGQVDETKVRAVREYLLGEFPTAVIYDFYSHDLGVQMFHLQDNYGALVHSAAVAVDLLAELDDYELGKFLERHKVARVLRQAGTAGVSVTKSGLKIERR